MLKPVFLLLIGLSVCLISTDSLSVANPQKSPIFILHQHKLKYPDYELDVRRVRFFSPAVGAFRGNNRLNRFEQEAEALLEKWLGKDMLLYYDLTLEVCDILSSTDLGDRIREQKIQVKYVRRALEKSREEAAAKMPLATELRLLTRIVPDPEYFEGELSGEDWAKYRSEKMELCARGFQRLREEIDEDFDFSNPPPLQPPLPPGVNLPPGVGPSAIKDAQLRAAYEKLIGEHNRKTQEFSRQDTLRHLSKSFYKQIGRYIVSAYLRPPHRVGELEDHLEKHVKDEDVKRSIRMKYAEGLLKKAQKR